MGLDVRCEKMDGLREKGGPAFCFDSRSPHLGIEQDLITHCRAPLFHFTVFVAEYGMCRPKTLPSSNPTRLQLPAPPALPCPETHALLFEFCAHMADRVCASGLFSVYGVEKKNPLAVWTFLLDQVAISAPYRRDKLIVNLM